VEDNDHAAESRAHVVERTECAGRPTRPGAPFVTLHPPRFGPGSPSGHLVDGLAEQRVWMGASRWPAGSEPGPGVRMCDRAYVPLVGGAELFVSCRSRVAFRAFLAAR
jgi:hypothetical protein